MRALALAVSVLLAACNLPEPLPPASLVVTVQPSSGTGGAALDPAPTVRVLDAAGNPVEDGVVVSVSLPAPSVGMLSGPRSVAAVGGLARFPDLSIDRAAQDYQLVFSCPGVTSVTSDAFDIGVGPASPIHSRVSFFPTQAVADGLAEVTVTGVVQDAGGNPVADHTLTLLASGTGNAIDGVATTDANGIFSAAFRSTRAEVKEVSASTATATLTGTVTFFAGEPSSADSVLGASHGSVTADGVTTTTLTLTVRDRHFNPVPDHAVALTASGTFNTLEPATGTTDANGVFTATLASTRAETKTLQAVIGAARTYTLVTFLAGAPSGALSTLAANPSSVTADGSSGAALSLTVFDAHGNRVANQAVSLAVSGTGNTLTVSSGTTDSAGSFRSTLRSTQAGEKVVTATFAGATATATVTFVPGPASATYSTFQASPASVLANGVATTTLTVTARDASGNPIADKPVSLSVSGTGNTLTPGSGTTNASGVFTATFTSTRAEAKTVSASVSPLTLVANVAFTAGPPSASRSLLVASPAAAEANGTSPSTLTLTVRDANDNPISGQAVSLAVSGTGNTLSPTSGTTDASGRFSATLASTVVETKTVTATAGAATLNTTVNFTPAASAAHSTLAAAPDTVLADGVAATTLTVTVRDASNNPIPGYGVSLSASGTQNLFSPASGVTDASGVFRAGLASTRAETKTVTATLGASTLEASVTFTPGPAVGAFSTLTSSSSAVMADGVATATLTVTARDAHGNTVPGQAVQLTATGTNNTFTPDPPDGTTDAAGVFSVTLASSTPESKTVSALINGSFSVSTEVTFGASLLLLAADIGDSALTSLKTRMEATGAFTRVDIFNAYTGTPTLAKLQEYSSVLFWTNYHLANKVTLGNNLADYFDSGGRVVIATFGYLSSSSWPNNNVAGRWLTDGYNLFALGGQAQSSASLGTVVEPSSPLMSGVSTLSANPFHYGTGAVANGGVVVAYWSNGRPLVVRGTVNGRNRVDLELFPPSYWTGDGVRLMQNALLY